jgi:hypothetical protein
MELNYMKARSDNTHPHLFKLRDAQIPNTGMKKLSARGWLMRKAMILSRETPVFLRCPFKASFVAFVAVLTEIALPKVNPEQTLRYKSCRIS